MKTEKGQALILIALGLIVLVGFTALAIDGGSALADRRTAQNAADNAALAAAYSLATSSSQSQANTAALNIATSNGYTEGTSVVEVEITNVPANACNNTGLGKDVTVTINSTVETMFAPVVGIDEVSNTVAAVARACESREEPLFFGNAVVGLDPDGLSFDSWGTSKWYIGGGGIFANHDARKKNNKENVEFLDGHCVTVVNEAHYFNCSPILTAPQLRYPEDIIPMLPRIPACNGVAYRGDDGKLHPQEGKDGSRVDHFEDDFAPGLYCITDAGGNIHGTVTGTDVTFYISDTSFTMKFNGGGAMAIQAPSTGEYAGILMFSGITDEPCTQNLHFRGNGHADNVGTIFLPSACIDARGNSDPHNNRTQLIGYNVTANGTGDVYINYEAEDNRTEAKPPSIDLLE